MRSSIAARRRPASSPSMACGSTPSAARGWSAIISPTPRPSTACRGAPRSVMCAIRRPARPSLRNVQPLFAELEAGGLAVAHNGNLTNGLTLRRELIRGGAICQSTTDTEVVLLLAARSRRSRIVDRFVEALAEIEGAYALVALTNKKLIGARDPLGIRPLVLGELDGSPILCSETCALDIIGAKFVRDVENGEVVVIDGDGVKSFFPLPRLPARPCIFEYIYFARPDSIVARPIGLRRPQGDGRGAGARGAGRRRRRRAGPRFRRSRRDRLCARLRPAVRTRHHPQPLCRAHLHSADPVDSRAWRQDEAQRQSRGGRGQARSC